MTVYLKQNTASQEVPLGYFVDSGDGNSEETTLTINNTDIKLWKAGATTLANKNSGGATHISNGIYYAVLDATDTNTLGSLVIFVHVSGALPVRLECVVLAANVYDSLIGGGDTLDVAVTSMANDVVTAAAIADNAIDAGALAANAITAAKIATDAITADKIAANAIGASELAADAVAEIADGVWDEAISGHLTAGSTGNALNAAGSAGDPWSTEIPGAYGAGTAGQIVGDSLDATVSSRLATAGYTAPDNATISAIETDTQDIQSRLPAALTAGGNMKADTLAINASTAAAAQLAKSAAVIVSGAAAAGTLSTTQMTTDLTEATDDHYNGRIIIWTSGVLTGQATAITDYAGSNKMVTFTAVTEAPGVGDTFVIV